MKEGIRDYLLRLCTLWKFFIGRHSRCCQTGSISYFGHYDKEAVKLAEGNLDTHSKKVVMNKEFPKTSGNGSRMLSDVESMIEKLTLARELWTLLSEEDCGKFFPCLLEHCFAHCVPCCPKEN